jgi:hypothetical protein
MPIPQLKGHIAVRKPLTAAQEHCREWIANLPDHPRYIAGEIPYPPQGLFDIAIICAAYTKEQVELERSKRAQLEGAIKFLQNILEPVHTAMRGIFGEIEVLELGETPMSDSPKRSAQPHSPVWDEWKKNLGPMEGKFIDALLIHGEMNRAQLRVAMRCAQNTVSNVASRLNKLGLLSKNGGKYSLKELP